MNTTTITVLDTETDTADRYLAITGIAYRYALEFAQSANTDEALMRDLLRESGRDRFVGRGMARFVITEDMNGHKGLFAVWVYVGDFVNPLANTVWK